MRVFPSKSLRDGFATKPSWRPEDVLLVREVWGHYYSLSGTTAYVRGKGGAAAAGLGEESRRTHESLHSSPA